MEHNQQPWAASISIFKDGCGERSLGMTSIPVRKTVKDHLQQIQQQGGSSYE
ncbi:MAG: hypothetical protein SWH54_12005 [Thermodesulfobacteriota bacterium]|nr:hypothetical protein [Thermodesulfobacteriota bacterium]